MSNNPQVYEQGIQQVSSSGGALNAEHYQTFEVAKANDDILGGTDIAKIRASQARTRAEAQAIYKMMSEMDRIEDVATSKSELLETSQLLAKYSVYGDQRIGEILRELPKAKGNQYTSADCGAPQKPTKSEAIHDAGIDTRTAYDLQAMAANPDVVEAVIAKAEADGRIVSRSQVLKAIKERDAANEALEDEIARLRNQPKPKPEVIEVKPADYDDLKKKVGDLSYENKRLNHKYQEAIDGKHESDRKLEQANARLGETERTRKVNSDIELLTAATNNYLRQYGGHAWVMDQLNRIDETTLMEFRKAITSVNAFTQNLLEVLNDRYGG